MTAKEKAQELVNRYANLDIENNNSGIGGFYQNMSKDDAKDCAMICVDEVLSATSLMSRSASANFTAFFYQQVKQEIEKL